MVKSRIATFQIGKSGFNPSLLETLKTAFKDRENIKVVLLKSSGHTKEKTQEIAEEIVSGLGENYTYRIIGFTINLKKHRKPMRDR